jgi:hypothetical protein
VRKIPQTTIKKHTLTLLTNLLQVRAVLTQYIDWYKPGFFEYKNVDLIHQILAMVDENRK